MTHSRWLVEKACSMFHSTWWIPGWNRSVFLSCPISWLTRRSARFDRWFWA